MVLLCVSFPISFLNVLYFLVCKSFTSLVKFTPGYFIPFDAVVKRNFFLFL